MIFCHFRRENYVGINQIVQKKLFATPNRIFPRSNQTVRTNFATKTFDYKIYIEIYF